MTVCSLLVIILNLFPSHNNLGSTYMIQNNQSFYENTREGTDMSISMGRSIFY